jgi:hypothetical protein
VKCRPSAPVRQMDTMDNAKFALGSSEPNATADEN